MTALIDLHFLPSLEYFCALLPYPSILFEKHEHFVKQTFRNRCYIHTAHGKAMLTIPLAERHGHQPVAAVKIDYRQRWQDHHWRTIESAYRKAPFYEHYAPELRDILYRKHTLLFDLNLEMLSFCLAALRWHKKVDCTTAYEVQTPLSVNDLRGVITAKTTYRERDFYEPQPYYQVFGSTFVANLSILDLLFCSGPDASALLQASARK